MLEKYRAFIELQIPKMKYKESGKKYYRIYTSPEEFVDIEAQTAYEALLKSNVKEACLIKQIIHRLGDFVDESTSLEPISENVEELEKENPGDEEKLESGQIENDEKAKLENEDNSSTEKQSE